MNILQRISINNYELYYNRDKITGKFIFHDDSDMQECLDSVDLAEETMRYKIEDNNGYVYYFYYKPFLPKNENDVAIGCVLVYDTYDDYGEAIDEVQFSFKVNSLNDNEDLKLIKKYLRENRLQCIFQELLNLRKANF